MRQWMVDARKRKNLTQQNLAENTGVTRQAIGLIEQGERFPRPETAKKIADALDEDVSRFFEPQEQHTMPRHISSA